MDELEEKVRSLQSTAKDMETAASSVVLNVEVRNSRFPFAHILLDRDLP